MTSPGKDGTSGRLLSSGRPALAPRHRVAQRLAIVEDHLLQRHRTEEIIAGQPGLRVVWSGETLDRLVDWMAHAPRGHHPQLVILDLQVDRGRHADPDEVRRMVNAGIKVLVVSALASPDQVRKTIRAGIAGVVGKRDSEADLVAAVWTVIGGGQWITSELAGVMAEDPSRPTLSEQEERALVLYASGLTMVAVAEALGVRPDTAKKYISRVKSKYAATGQAVHSKVDLHRAAQRDGFLT